MEQHFKEYSFEEILVEVAWESQFLRDEGKLKYSLLDSWDEKCEIFRIAKQFYDLNKDRIWKNKGEFYDEVVEYAETMLVK